MDFIEKKASAILVALALFGLPLFYYPGFIYSFSHGKEIFFKAGVLLLLFLFCLFFVRQKRLVGRNVFKSPLFVLYVVQLILFALSNILSDATITSFYGSYTRGLGFFMYLFVFLFFVYLSFYLNQSRVKNLLKCIFLSGFLVAIYGVIQKIGWDPFFSNYGTNIFVGRVFSFLGNPSYLGQFMALEAVVAGYLFLSEKRGVWKWLGGAGVIVMICTLLLSGTRSAVLALMGMGGLLAAKYRREGFELIRKKAIYFVFPILFIAVLFSFLPDDRYSLSSLSSRSLKSRFEIWNGTIELVSEKLIFGYGGDTFQIYFPEIVSKEFLTLEEDVNMSADRVHNEFLEMLFSYGALGLSLYLVFIFYVGRLFFVSTNQEVTALSLVLLGNWIQNQFAFPDISINVLVAFCLASLVALNVKSEWEVSIARISKWMWFVVGVFLIISAFLIGVYNPYQSQKAYAFSKYNYDNYESAVHAHKLALVYTPYYSQLWYELMMLDSGSMEDALYYLEQIEGESGNVLAWKGNYYSDFDMDLSVESFKKALQKNPYHPSWIRAFADVLYKQGDYPSALFFYDKYLKSIPDYWKSDVAEMTLAEKASYETYLMNDPYFGSTLERIDEILEELRDYELL